MHEFVRPANSRSFAVAFLGIGAATVVFWLVRDFFGEGDLAQLYLPVVALLAALADTRTGLYAALLGLFAGKFFFVPTYYSLHIKDPKDWVSLTVSLVVGLAVGIQLKRRESQARAREEESALLYRFSACLSMETSTQGLTDLLMSKVLPHSGVRQAALFLPSATTGLTAVVTYPVGLTVPPAVGLEAGICYRTATSSAADLIPPWELEARPRVPRAPLERLGLREPTTTGIYLPLRATSGLEGVLYLLPSTAEFQAGRGRLLTAVSYLTAAFLERQRLQTAAARAEALQETDRLKSVLVSSVSHELRTPLASVTATLTNLLESDTLWDLELLRPDIAAACDDLQRLNDGIGALLDLSRLESGTWVPKREWCELGEILGTLLKRIPQPRRSRIQVRMPVDLPPLRLDYAQWVRAFQNLIENALAYSPPPCPVEVNASVPGHNLLITVDDRGPGVDLAERSVVFEKFYRGAAASVRPAGSGLGLAITKDIVEYHGGRVWIEDRPGGGARFMVLLPLDDVVLASAAQAMRILVVDDEEAIRHALKSILTTRQYEVQLAGNATEAIDLCIEKKPDLVILDLSLPGVDGFEVCQQLRTWLAAPILVLSVRTSSADKIRALDLGADDYLTKPFVAGELLARIRALLRRAEGMEAADAIITVEDLEIDLPRRRVIRGGEEIRLTRTEFDILAYLARNADRVVTANQIIEQVWGPDYLENRHMLRVHVANLRKKVEPDPAVPRYVVTEPGVGYSFFTS